ncbi:MULTISPECIES: surface-adhesin E family protein [Sphingomonas]|uniref:surface-adhesin E family protein n=1 Tax=Sphingomonas TaxID=13687 RepID=UPI00126A281B|nr:MULTISPECIES: surface-adhesin E family protein [Sphingomonas]
MKLPIVVFASAALAFSTPALAEHDYLFVALTGDNASGIFLDLETIQKTPTRKDVWTLIVNLAPEAQLPDHVSYAMRRYTYDCDARTTDMTYAALFTSRGESIRQGPTATGPRPIVPSTISETMANLLCKGEVPTFEHVATIEEARTMARKIAGLNREPK